MKNILVIIIFLTLCLTGRSQEIYYDIVRYQSAIIDVKTDRVLGYEAWIKSDGSIIKKSNTIKIKAHSEDDYIDICLEDQPMFYIGMMDGQKYVAINQVGKADLGIGFIEVYIGFVFWQDISNDSYDMFAIYFIEQKKAIRFLIEKKNS